MPVVDFARLFQFVLIDYFFYGVYIRIAFLPGHVYRDNLQTLRYELCIQSFIVGNDSLQVPQLTAQKCTSTGLPLRSSSLIGSELNHLVPPLREGNGLSIRSGMQINLLLAILPSIGRQQRLFARRKNGVLTIF